MNCSPAAPPFEPERLRQAAVDEVFRIIREEEPVKPSTRLTQSLVAADVSRLASKSEMDRARSRRQLRERKERINCVRGDLDWVVMKALEKLPARRYETASALAAELRRHLNNEPVLARPPSPTYRFQKMVSRNKLAFAASAAVLVTLMAGLLFSSWRFIKEREARQVAVAQAARAEQVARLLKDMLAGVGPSVALGRDTTMLREILDRTAEHVSRELKAHPDIEAELRVAIGKAYVDLGELGKAEQMHREALRRRESYFGPTSAAVSESLLCLCSVFNFRSGAGDLAEGEALARRAVAIEEARSPQSSAELAGALEQLGWNLGAQGRMLEARPVYRQVLKIRRSIPDTPQLYLVNSLNALSATLSHDTNSVDEAESLIREALSLQSKTEAGPSPLTADLLHTLSMVLEKRKKLPEAESAIQESITIRRKLWGESNVMLADPLARLAQVFDAEGKLAEEETALRECVTILTNSYGAGNLRLTVRFMNTLTELLHRQKHWPEAEATARDAVALCRAGNDHGTYLLHSLHWQSIILMAQSQWTNAEPALRETLTLCDQFSSGPQPVKSPEFCAQMRRSLGESLVRQGKFTEAEPLLLSSCSVLQNASGKWDLQGMELGMQNLVQLYQATARPAQAAEWSQKLTEFRKTQTSKPAAP